MEKVVIITICLFFTTNLLAQTLHIYGGSNHDVYLGCLNCNEYDSKSIWNEYGKYGNGYNGSCIWNEYGTYGNEYSSYSPWSGYASNPPVIVDGNGTFYGYFTVNKHKSKRAEFRLALILYQCYDKIRENVSEWYNEIF